MRYGLFFTIVFFVGCGDKSTAIYETETPNTQLPAGTEITPYEEESDLGHGIVRSESGISTEGDVLGGRQHGSWISYDDKQVITDITNYDRGILQGVSLTFDRQGYVKTKANYFNGELHGEYILYKRRKIIERRNYQGAVLSGVVTKYYDDGTLMQEAPYLNGKLDGIGKWYDADGNLTIAYRYENGELVDKEPALD